MRILALDPGERRIGLALSDPSGLLALPHGVFDAHPRKRLQKRLAALIEAEAVGAVVVGEPLELDGEAGAQAESAEALVTWLRSWLQIPVHVVDERLTSALADRYLAESGVASKDRRGKRDAIAAALILETFLARSAPGPPLNRP